MSDVVKTIGVLCLLVGAFYSPQGETATDSQPENVAAREEVVTKETQQKSPESDSTSANENAASEVDEAPFYLTSLAEAERQLKKNPNKSVMVFFTMHNCGPCLILDRAIQRDEKLKAWWKEWTIPVKLQYEDQPEFVRDYFKGQKLSFPILIFYGDPAKPHRMPYSYLRNPHTYFQKTSGVLLREKRETEK